MENNANMITLCYIRNSTKLCFQVNKIFVGFLLFYILLKDGGIIRSETTVAGPCQTLKELYIF